MRVMEELLTVVEPKRVKFNGGEEGDEEVRVKKMKRKWRNRNLIIIL